jgi:hypothetical protein
VPINLGDLKNFPTGSTSKPAPSLRVASQGLRLPLISTPRQRFSIFLPYCFVCVLLSPCFDSAYMNMKLLALLPGASIHYHSTCPVHSLACLVCLAIYVCACLIIGLSLHVYKLFFIACLHSARATKRRQPHKLPASTLSTIVMPEPTDTPHSTSMQLLCV